jgi:hypothetical protein
MTAGPNGRHAWQKRLLVVELVLVRLFLLHVLLCLLLSLVVSVIGCQAAGGKAWRGAASSRSGSDCEPLLGPGTSWLSAAKRLIRVQQSEQRKHRAEDSRKKRWRL